MTDLPDMRVKALVNFPAVVNGGTGLSVTRDVPAPIIVRSGLQRNCPGYWAIPPGEKATTSILLFESVQGNFSRMTLADFKTLLASIP